MFQLTKIAIYLAVAFLVSISVSSSSDEVQSPSSMLASKLLPAKLRSPRSLGDMMEKVKNRIFGKKQAAASSASSNTASASNAGPNVASANNISPMSSQQQQQAAIAAASRQPWVDMSAFGGSVQPFAGYPALAQYPWASQGLVGAGSSSPFIGYMPQAPGSGAAAGQASGQDLSVAGSVASVSSQSPGGNVISSPMNQAPGQPSSALSGGGLLSSASQLISHYLSPNGGQSQQQQQQQQQQQASGQMMSGAAASNGANQQLSPGHASYNEFASVLDNMVAQSGLGSQSQQMQQPQQQQQSQIPNQLANGQNSQQRSQQVAPGAGSNYPISSAAAAVTAGGASSQQQGVQDQEMSGSSPMQSYVPNQSQMPQPKSSMVSLAEQLAPGSQFNKLVSFPFSLTNNDDPNKEGRFKLHIPFVNQHVKRSDAVAGIVPTSSNSGTSQENAAALAFAGSQQRQLNQFMSTFFNQVHQQQQNPNQIVQQQQNQQNQIQSPQQQQYAAQTAQLISAISAQQQQQQAAPNAVAKIAPVPASASAPIAPITSQASSSSSDAAPVALQMSN